MLNEGLDHTVAHKQVHRDVAHGHCVTASCLLASHLPFITRLMIVTIIHTNPK